MSAIETRQLFNFIQGSDISGVSSYDIWKSLNPNGTEAEFLEYIRSGPQGEQGPEGPQGSSARVYFLMCSDNVIERTIHDTLLPSSITFNAYYREGTNAAKINYTGRFIIQETTDGYTWTNKYTSNADESSVNFIPSSTEVKFIKCKLYAAGGTTEELDVQNIPILTDAGLIKVLVATLSNEAHTISCDYNGENCNYEGCNTQVKVYSGVTEVTQSATFNINTSKGVTGAWDENTHVYTITDLSVENGYVDFEITFGGNSIVKRFTVAKIKAGANGEPGSSTYDIWVSSGHEGDVNDFLEFLKGEPGPKGQSTYEVWTGLGNTGTAQEFIESLKGKDGTSVTILGTKNSESELPTTGNNNGDGYIINGDLFVWGSDGWMNVGQIRGPKGDTGEQGPKGDTGEAGPQGPQGDAGDSAYDIWKLTNPDGTEAEFLESIKGKSAYELWLEKEGNEGKTEEEFLKSVAPQADWLQNDPNGEGYIENRTHYVTDPVETPVVEESTIEFQDAGGFYMGQSQAFSNLVEGCKCTVVWDGTTYEDLVCYFDENTGGIIIGSPFGDFSEYPFCMMAQDNMFMCATNNTNASHTISVTVYITQIVQLDEKYISYKPGLKVEGKTLSRYEYNEETDQDELVEYTGGVNAEIFNDYNYNIASGNYSHAEGLNTTASGECSHAEGQNTTASGRYSHAEGLNTTASGECSHTEGQITIASGRYSHAEGKDTTASGNYSHAEGGGTTAYGESSHAEGGGTTASGNNSHAEGDNTTASGSNSHAEGGGTTASGNYSHAEGYKTTASGNYSHAEGISINKLPDTITKDSTNEDIINTWKTTKFSLAKGEASHIEGYHTLALGDYSHAEGNHTTASGNNSHAEGYKTTASGRYSHAEGLNTTASGINSHAEGQNTTASGHTSHAEGNHTTASGEYQHVQGKYNIEDTDNKYAHIVGNGTADNARSNAHTVDWDGNAWYAGTVEATALILKSPNGTRFQITVGDDGVLTATEITE